MPQKATQSDQTVNLVLGDLSYRPHSALVNCFTFLNLDFLICEKKKDVEVELNAIKGKFHF